MLKLSMQDFRHDTTSVGDECNCPMVSTFFSTTLLGNWDGDWLFPVLWQLLGLQICWHIECNTLMASSSRVFHSSPGIPSHPLALFAAVLPKTYLISYSRMSGSGWLTTPFQSSSSSGYFLYSSSVYSFHPFLISSATTKSLPFISFIVPIFGQNIPFISPVFLKRSLLFPLLLFSSSFTHCSLKMSFLSPHLFFGTLCLVGFTFTVLPCFLLLCFLQLLVMPPQITTLPSCFSSSLGFFFFYAFCTIFGEGNGNPLQYSCLENPMDRGA